MGKPASKAASKVKGNTGAKPAAKLKQAPAKKAPAQGNKSKTAVRAPQRSAGAPAKGSAGIPPASGKKGADGKSYSRLLHIDDVTLDKIIEKLEDMRTESLAKVNVKMTDSSPMGEDADVGDDMDLASQDRDREFDLLMHERHLRRLQQVDEAFDRIREGSYGLCEGTEEPINPKRLLIMPLARYSIEYQQEQEKTLGRTPDEFYFEEESTMEGEEE